MIQTKNWRKIAIIFIILFTIETLVVAGFIYVGLKEIVKEDECMYNVCQGTISFIYDSYSQLCYCYINGEIIKQVYLGSK